MNRKEVAKFIAVAKAAGVPLKDDFAERHAYYLADPLMWNPRDNSGDALRLAVKLGIRVEPSSRGCSVNWPCANGLRVETVLNSVIGADSETATREAIFRAAAEMVV